MKSPRVSRPSLNLDVMKRVIPALVTALALISSGCSSTAAPAASVAPFSSAPSSARVLTAVYYVEGTADGADITYSTATGIQQQSRAAIPLQMTDGTFGIQMKGAQVPRTLTISAQNTGAKGTVTCSIRLNGEKVAENTSSGAYAIASCTYAR